jgi:hypothetical protein
MRVILAVCVTRANNVAFNCDGLQYGFVLPVLQKDGFMCSTQPRKRDSMAPVAPTMPIPSLAQQRATSLPLEDVTNYLPCGKPLSPRLSKTLATPYKADICESMDEPLSKTRQKSTWRCLKEARICIIAESLNFECEAYIPSHFQLH